MKKNITAFFSGLVVGFVVFWGPSVFSKLFGTDKIPFYRFLNASFSGNQILIVISYFILGIAIFSIYWSLTKLTKKEKNPFPVIPSLLFAFAFILPLGLLVWAVVVALSHGSFVR
jgi:hypothetical protein